MKFSRLGWRGHLMCAELRLPGQINAAPVGRRMEGAAFLRNVRPSWCFGVAPSPNMRRCRH